MHEYLIVFALRINEIFDDTFLVVLCALIFTLFFLIRKNYLPFAIISVFLTEIFILSLKNIFQIARPINPIIEVTGYAMPSGHAGNSFLVSTLLTFYIYKSKLNNKIKIVLAGLFNLVAILISASRFILKVHSVPQIVVGAIIGIVIPVIVFQIMKFKKYKVS